MAGYWWSPAGSRVNRQLTELFERRGTRRTLWGGVEPAGQADPGIRGSEGVGAFYEDARRPMRADPFGLHGVQAAGLTLVQIRSIVELRDHGETPCTHVSELIDDKLLDVRQRISELAALEEELEQLQVRSQRLDPADCTDAQICQILAAHS